MPSPKTPQMIVEELQEMLTPKERVVDDPNGGAISAVFYDTPSPTNESLHDWLRSSMQSLLLHVMGEMPKRYIIVCPASTPDDEQHWPEDCNCSIDLVYNYAITDCLAVIQSTIDSIKE